ncbi:MAG: BrnT family toxin [Candidatus Binatia bacterium]
MEVREIIWLDIFVEKLWRKQHVRTEEVEDLFAAGPRVRRVARGNVAGEDVYSAMGRTTRGRYLMVFCSQSREPRFGH